MEEKMKAEDIKEFARVHGISVNEAKMKLDRLAMMQHITNAKTVDDLKPILLKLAEEMK